jgi:hypothetical protein
MGGRLPKKEKNEVKGWCRFSPLGGIIPIPCYNICSMITNKLGLTSLFY